MFLINWLLSFHDKSLINIYLRIKKERITNYIIFYEAEFIQGLPNKQAPFRNFHIDDLHVLMTIERIYLCQLEIKKTTDSSNVASYMILIWKLIIKDEWRKNVCTLHIMIYATISEQSWYLWSLAIYDDWYTKDWPSRNNWSHCVFFAWKFVLTDSWPTFQWYCFVNPNCDFCLPSNFIVF